MWEATRKFTTSTVIQHLPTAETVSRHMPSPVMFFPPVLDENSTIRSRQIQRALNQFVIRLESLIENKSIDEPEAFRGAITWRQKSLNTYFKQLNPEWGRWAKEVKEKNPDQSASKRLKTKE